MLKELLGFIAALANGFIVILVKGAGLCHNTMLHSQVEDVTRLTNAFVVHNIKLRNPEGRRNLILDYLHFGAVA